MANIVIFEYRKNHCKKQSNTFIRLSLIKYNTIQKSIWKLKFPKLNNQLFILFKSIKTLTLNKERRFNIAG